MRVGPSTSSGSMQRRATLVAFVLATTAPLPAWAQPAPGVPSQPGGGGGDNDAYRLHMDNGVKLYQDKNFAAAIAEFEAAYKARPKASPLMNISLCYKSVFAYPKAIAALET